MPCRQLLTRGWRKQCFTQGKQLALALSLHPHSPPSTTISRRGPLLLTHFASLFWHGLQHLPPLVRVHLAAWCMVGFTFWECWSVFLTSLHRWISNLKRLPWLSRRLPAFKSTLMISQDNLWERTNTSEKLPSEVHLEVDYDNLVDNIRNFNLYTTSDVNAERGLIPNLETFDYWLMQVRY